jgi:hypothetical protein
MAAQSKNKKMSLYSKAKLLMSSWFKMLNIEPDEVTLVHVGPNRTNAFVASSAAC